MTSIAVIPARYGSSRFPGKPLARLCGKPMIEWVYCRVSEVKAFTQVIVATDDERIQEAVEGFGGRVRMTSPDHPSGTDRVWEVAQGISEAEIIFNVQGDEPLINPRHLEDALAALKLHHEWADIVTMRAPMRSESERADPNIVKVVSDRQGKALYFSRAPIPYDRDGGNPALLLEQSWRHVGIYGYRRSALEQFVRLPVSALEDLEKLEQLRALEHGLQFYVHSVGEAPIGVDTPEDLARVEALMKQTASF